MPCFPLKSLHSRKYEFVFDSFIRQIVPPRLHISFFLNAKLLSPPNETIAVGLPFGTPLCPPEYRQKNRQRKVFEKKLAKKDRILQQKRHKIVLYTTEELKRKTIGLTKLLCTIKMLPLQHRRHFFCA